MTKSNWIPIGVRLKGPLQEIAQIASQKGLDKITIGAENGKAYALIEDYESGARFSIDVDKHGHAELSEEGKVFYVSK